MNEFNRALEMYTKWLITKEPEKGEELLDFLETVETPNLKEAVLSLLNYELLSKKGKFQWKKPKT